MTVTISFHLPDIISLFLHFAYALPIRTLIIRFALDVLCLRICLKFL